MSKLLGTFRLSKSFIFLVLLLISMSTPQTMAAPPPGSKVTAKAKAEAEAEAHEADSGSSLLSQSDIQQLVSVLEDSTQRKEFLKTLRLIAKVQEVQRPSRYIAGEGGLLYSLIQPLQEGLASLAKWIKTTFVDIQHLPRDFTTLQTRLLEQSTWLSLCWFIVALGLAFFSGLLIELLLKRLIRPYRPKPTRFINKLIALAIFEWVPIGAFGLMALLTVGLVLEEDSQAFVSVSSCLVALVFVRVFMAFLSSLVIGQGRYLYYNKAIALLALGLYVMLHALVQLGMSDVVYFALLKLYGLFILILFNLTIWIFRVEVADALKRSDIESAAMPKVLHALTLWFIESWSAWATVISVLLYTAWVSDDPEVLGERLVSVAVTVLCITAVLLSPFWLTSTRALTKGRHPIVSNLVELLMPVTQILLYLAVFVGLLNMFGVNILFVLKNPMVGPIVTGIFSIAFILTIAWAAWLVANSFINMQLNPKTAKGQRRKPTVFVMTFFPILRSIFHWAIVIFTSILVLQELGFPVVPLLYGVSVLGLAISLGCQNLVKDIITGFLTLMEGVISVGEVIRIGEDTGTIEAISLRGLKLRHQSGALQTIPFSEITSITNLSRDFSVVPIELTLPFATDIGKVSELMTKTFDEMQGEDRYKSMILEPIQLKGIEKFASNAVLVSAFIKILPDPGGNFAQEFNRRLKVQLDRAKLATV